MALAFYILNGLRIVIIVDALATWVVAENAFPRNLTRLITEPLYSPLHALLGRVTGGIDLAPLIALIVLQLIGASLRRSGHRP